MPSYVTPKRATEFIFYVSLQSQANGNVLQTNPTLAAGDVKISKDGAAEANLTTLPVVTPASSKRVKVTVSASEMTADNVTITFSDASGDEWCDLTVNIQTTVLQIDDALTSGAGARTVTVTVEDQATDPIQNARVSMRLAGAFYVLTTDVNGQCTFNLDDGTWTVAITAQGYSFSGDTLVVDGTETPTYTMTTTSITPPADPAFCTLAIRVWGTNGAVAVGVNVKVRLAAPPTGDGEMFNSSDVTDATGADGYALFTIPRGSQVKYWVGSSEKNLDSVATDQSVVYVENHIGNPNS